VVVLYFGFVLLLLLFALGVDSDDAQEIDVTVPVKPTLAKAGVYEIPFRLHTLRRQQAASTT
jgi:hypothetical protein